MKYAATIAVALLFGAGAAQAAKPVDATEDLRQQLADSEELASGMRDQIDVTINRAEAAEAKAQRLEQEITVLRQQREATQARLIELQRRALESPSAPPRIAGAADSRGDLAALNEANRKASAEIARLNGEVTTLQRQLAAANKPAPSSQAAEFTRHADELKAAKIEASDLRRQVAELQAAAAAAPASAPVAATVATVDSEAPELRAQLEAARAELAQVRSDSAGNASAAAALSAELKTTQEQAATLRRERDDALAAVTAQTPTESLELPELRTQLATARAELAQARADSVGNAESAAAFAAEMQAARDAAATAQAERDAAVANAGASSKAQEASAELPKLREQLATAQRDLATAAAARESAAADARNLANELRTTRADRDKYQRSAIENADRISALMEQLNTLRNGPRTAN